MNRRNFFGAIPALVIAPRVVRAEPKKNTFSLGDRVKCVYNKRDLPVEKEEECRLGRVTGIYIPETRHQPFHAWDKAYPGWRENVSIEVSWDEPDYYVTKSGYKLHCYRSFLPAQAFQLIV